VNAALIIKTCAGCCRGLREAILEQVGTDQTDRLRRALLDALDALSG